MHDCDLCCTTLTLVLVVCHAEMNAIVNRTSTSYNLKGCTLYTTLSPCVECAKLIIRSGIKEVVWAEKFIREAPETKKLVDRTKVYAPNFECRYDQVITIHMHDILLHSLIIYLLIPGIYIYLIKHNYKRSQVGYLSCK